MVQVFTYVFIYECQPSMACRQCLQRSPFDEFGIEAMRWAPAMPPFDGGAFGVGGIEMTLDR